MQPLSPPLPFICRAVLQPNRRQGLFNKQVSSKTTEPNKRTSAGRALGMNENARLVVRLAAWETRTVTSGDSREVGRGSLYCLRKECTTLCTATFKLQYDMLKRALMTNSDLKGFVTHLGYNVFKYST